MTSVKCADHDDDMDMVDLSVVVQQSATCTWTPVRLSSRRATWQPAPDHSSPVTVSVSLPRSATVAEVIRRVIDHCPAASGEVPASAGYDLVDVQLDSLGRSVAERLLRQDDCVMRVTSRGTTARLELRPCARRRTGSCNTGCDDSSTLTSLHALQRHRGNCPADLCDLPELSEASLLDSLRQRFDAGSIYTYVGAILIAVNPFRYYPIYNPKYSTMYQGCGGRRAADLPPHIFAVADAAYAELSRRRCDQCVVISGESGSGKTQTANLVLNHLSALSRRIFYSDAKVEESILSAGPVLEAFGNAKTVHNNNSSRFGKFVQVNYWQNGTVHGASIEKYLLEKSRIVQQTPDERNYHVFYYLLAGCSETEEEALLLKRPQDYFYLNQASLNNPSLIRPASDFWAKGDSVISLEADRGSSRLSSRCFSDLTVIDRLLSATRIIVMVVADHSTAWSIRKQLVEMRRLDVKFDLSLADLVLSKHPKSEATFAHRRWLLGKLFEEICLDDTSCHSSDAAHQCTGTKSGSVARVTFTNFVSHPHSDLRHSLVLHELSMCQSAADRYHSNYNAWNHRIWVMNKFTCCQMQMVEYELEQMCQFVSMHVSDHSGFHYQQFLLSCLKQLLGDEQFLLRLKSELQLTQDLIQLYPGHEAIWYHRYIVHSLVQLEKSSADKLQENHRNSCDADAECVAIKKTKLREVNACHLVALSCEIDYCHQLLDDPLTSSMQWHMTLIQRHLAWTRRLCQSKSSPIASFHNTV